MSSTLPVRLLLRILSVLALWWGSASAEEPCDILNQAREWTVSGGLIEARAKLVDAMRAADDSHGFFERRIVATNADKTLVFPGSLATQPPATRARTGIFLVLGYNQNQGRSPPIIEDAAKFLVGMGYRAALIDMPPRQSTQADAAIIRDFLAKELPLVDQAAVIGFSKGSGDLSCFWIDEAQNLPRQDLRKIRLWVNCSGVIRGSHVARWLTTDKRWRGSLFRAWLTLKAGKLEYDHGDLRSLALDPWEPVPPGYLARLVPGLHCINLAAVPDGADGFPTTDPLFRLLGRLASQRYPGTGPTDGLVETASSLLPPTQNITQWIVPIVGSHALLDGTYSSGNRVASDFGGKDEKELHSGRELLDDILRALPRSLVEK